MMTDDERSELEQSLDKLKQRQVKLNEEIKRATQPAPFHWETKQGRKEMAILQLQAGLAQLLGLASLAALVFLFLVVVSGCQAYQDAHPKQIIVTVCSDNGSDCKTLKGEDK